MRLKIKHEWLYRISPRLFRKVNRVQNEWRGKPSETGDEIWLHIKPTKDSIDKHLQDTEGRSNVKKEKYEGALPMTIEATEQLGPSLPLCVRLKSGHPGLQATRLQADGLTLTGAVRRT